ncbi:MAG: hypothetical protein PHU94_01095 [Bacilli bacterium]|nr:hypothetical protein [Bacilli bacterium]MDD4733306.1 hypothetical protein [Bacilli bacterium]
MNNENKNVILETEEKTCPATAYQTSTICVPVSVKPFAKTGTTKTKCCGSPIVSSDTKICNGVKNGECTFTISQSICIEVPVEFGAKAEVGDTYVECTGASSEESTCNDCQEQATVLKTVKKGKE